MWIFQERFIFPGHFWQGQKWTIVPPAADHEFIQLRGATGERITLLLQKAAEKHGALADSPAPTILFFYGGGGTIAASLDLLKTWRELGANVAIVDYPGYGMSGGEPSERALYASADAAYDFLRSRSDIDPAKIIIVGQSLGTGIAIDLAARKPCAALVLFSPYTNMGAMAHLQYPWLPTSLILRHYFRSDQKIAQVSAPILIVHGRQDHTIPIQMSKDLAAIATKQNVTTLFVDADHNDLFDRTATEMNDAMRPLIERVHAK
jgi:pimeloyl-ACP methyl ester carboxylesterase